MVAFGLVAFVLAALASVSECRAHGHLSIHHRRFSNATSVAIGTGSVGASSTIVSPSTETKTFTYTLGDGRAITTTVVKVNTFWSQKDVSDC